MRRNIHETLLKIKVIDIIRCCRISPNSLTHQSIDSENRGTPKSSIINHPFWGTSIFGNNHIWKQLESISIKKDEFPETEQETPCEKGVAGNLHFPRGDGSTRSETFGSQKSRCKNFLTWGIPWSYSGLWGWLIPKLLPYRTTGPPQAAESLPCIFFEMWLPHWFLSTHFATSPVWSTAGKTAFPQSGRKQRKDMNWTGLAKWFWNLNSNDSNDP